MSMSETSENKLSKMGSLDIDDHNIIDKESMGVGVKQHLINVLDQPEMTVFK